MLHFRKGTRSRPNVKVPKYLIHSDYEDIIKPSARDTSETEETIFPIEKIKAEPIDVVENDLTYNTDAAVHFLDQSEDTSMIDIEGEEQEQNNKDASFEEIDDFVKITRSAQHLIKDIDVNVEGEEDASEGTKPDTEGTIEEAVQSLRESRGVEFSTERPKVETAKPEKGLIIKLFRPSGAGNNEGPVVLEKVSTEVEEVNIEEERTMPVLSPKE